MRYSRMSAAKEETPKSKGIVFFVVIIAVAAAIYFIGAAKVGNFVSEKIVVPVISWFTGQQPEPSASDNNGLVPANPPASSGPSSGTSDTEKEDVTLSGQTIYALQAGVFQDADNAQDLSASLAEKGGAGYIWNDGEVYRVFLAGYQTQAEADSVKTRLQSDQSMETKVYEIVTEKVTLQIETDAQTLETIQNAIAMADGLPTQLMELSLSLDKGDLGLTAAKEKAAALYKEAGELKNKVDETGQNTDNNIIKGLSEFYQSACNSLEKLSAETDTVALSSQIKQAYLSAGVAKQALSNVLGAIE